MSELRWEFEKANPRSVRRDPFEAEFFTGEEESEEVFGRTDSLVREAIQNSLDARTSDHLPAIVRFAISNSGDELRSDRAQPYLLGLLSHMRELGNETLSGSVPPAMSWLAVEDFNTRGLTGEPSRSSDPIQDPEKEAFYWFWRNVGRSGKSGTDRGRWGLGKTVFPATSRINAMYGLTIRSDDHRALLMGQAVTKSHDLNGESFEPEAFFHDAAQSSAIQMPCEDPKRIAAFVEDFNLRRHEGQPGLSIVVPYPFQRLQAKEILRSVIVHYFLAILRGQLVVSVEGPGCPERTVNRDSLQTIAMELDWNGRRAEKKHSPPPFDLAIWAIEKQSTLIDTLNRAGQTRVPEWSAELFPEGMQERLRSELQQGARVALRIPMTVELKDNGLTECYFDVFLERDRALERSEDYFVREGMTIGGLSTLAGSAAYRGLVMVDDDGLSKLLGDSEGPAHNDWNTGEARPDRTYIKWKRRVSFVKASLMKLIALLSPPPVGLDRDLLKEIFWVPGEESGPSNGATNGSTKRKRGATPPPPPPPKPKPYRVDQVVGGFRVTRGEGEIPERFVIRAAYDIPNGNPLDSWSKFDFDFSDDAIAVEVQGGRLTNRSANRLEFEPVSPDFTLTASGFEGVRDIYVDIKAQLGEIE